MNAFLQRAKDLLSRATKSAFVVWAKGLLASLVENVVWRRYYRGVIWLAVAVVGFWGIEHMHTFGLTEYTTRRFGALMTAAASVWGGYRISRDVLRLDPSAFTDERARSIAALGRALFIGLLTVAICAGN